MSHPSFGYSRVSPRFWAQAQEEEWTDDMVILGLYLLTCEHRTTEGIFRLPLEYMAADLAEGWVTERVRVTLAALVSKGFVEYDEKARVVFLPKAMKYQRPDNRNQQIAALNNVLELPETPLLRDFVSAAKHYCPAFADMLTAQGLPQGLPEPLPEGLPQGIPDPPAPTPAPTPTLKPLCADSAESPPRKPHKVPRVRTPDDTDWQARDAEILAATDFPSDYRRLAELMAEGNKTGKVALSRVIRELYEPLLELEHEVSRDAMRAGLRAAITKGAPNANYVKRAAESYERRSRAPTGAGEGWDDFYTGGEL